MIAINKQQRIALAAISNTIETLLCENSYNECEVCPLRRSSGCRCIREYIFDLINSENQIIYNLGEGD